MAAGTDARRIAFDVLLRVTTGGAFAGMALDSALRERPDLDRRERALATELTYGAIRRSPSLDELLACRSRRPLESLDDRVLVLLRLGAYQLLHMRVPDHAAVGETVGLARKVGARGAAGFINGVLRSLAREPKVDPPSLEEDPARHLLLSEALPRWLYEEWSRDLSPQEVAEVASAMNAPASVNLRAGSRFARDAALARLREAGVDVRGAALSPFGIVVEEGMHPEEIPGWTGLGLQAQDEGAQLVTAYALLPSSADCRDAASRTIRSALDACAAPGGKTCHLAQCLPSSRIVALDLHRRRAERVGAEAQRLGLSGRIEVHAADATKPLPFAEEASFDLVLVDAPCTGLGTLRRHPEIKLTRTADDIGRLAALQLRLLRSISRYVVPGGRLVYAVCTNTRAEGPELIDELLASAPDFETDPPRPLVRAGRKEPPRAEPSSPAGSLEADLSSVPWADLVDETGALRLLTHRHGTDGFYAMRLRKTPSKEAD